MDLALELRNITKMFGDFKAVDDVSFKVYPGETLGLVGESDPMENAVFLKFHKVVSLTELKLNQVHGHGLFLYKLHVDSISAAVLF